MASSYQASGSTALERQEAENPSSTLYNLPYEIRQMILKLALVGTPYSIALSFHSVHNIPSGYDGNAYQNYEGYQSDDESEIIGEDSDDTDSDSEGESEDTDREEDEVPEVKTNRRTMYAKEGEDELETVYKDYQFGPYPLKDIDDVGSRVEKRMRRTGVHKMHESRIAGEARRNKCWRCWCEYTGSSSKGLFHAVDKPVISAQILRVCRRFYEEGVNMLYGKNRFLVQSMTTLQSDLVDVFDAKSLQRMKNIGFTSCFPLKVDLKTCLRAGRPFAESVSLSKLRNTDLLCWYNLRNLTKIDFFFSWHPALLNRRATLRAYKSQSRAAAMTSFESQCLNIECTARTIAAHLHQDFEDCREKLAAEGKALCCNDGRPIYDWELYLEPKISTATNEVSNDDEQEVARSKSRELIRDLVAEYWELARKQRLYCQGPTEFEDRRSLTSQIALQTERLIEGPVLPDSAFEISVNPRFKRKKEKDVEMELPLR